MTASRILIDADTGVDDALAIALASNSPELSVVAITTVAGNAEVGECTRNSLLLAESLWGEEPPPVAEGATSPLEEALTTAPEVHGDDGLGGARETLPSPATTKVGEPAHEFLARVAAEHAGEITLVATGPLTNLALAHRANPDALSAFRRIVVMGGAFEVPGNTGPVAEFNFYVDPRAADIILGAGLDVTVVPLDVTTGVMVRREELRALPSWRSSLRAAGPSALKTLAPVIARAIDHYVRYQFAESGLDAGYMHDPVAMSAALAPGLVGTREVPVRVITEGPDRGRSVEADDGRPPVKVAVNVDKVAVRGLIHTRVLAPLFG